ncbi:hypothetical protein POTOM_029483 [Populus tomentosa]|uniref:SGNH hydrolase-type esterase domain-containing protein n=1 Tax=Populus tomentosa TaxID=118781 RepID=A0A8X8CJP8_POPTO|nr:hypothetical protein POTOM_029483 [Populus tomentosa]
MVGPSRPQFVLFGSSIVQLCFSHGGWGSILSDIYSRKADILLRGYYGWNSRRAVQVLDQVFPKDAPVQPALVIVYFGGNDSMGPHSSGLGPHVPLDEYMENMRKIAVHLKIFENQSLSDTTRIIFMSCPPVDETRVSSSTSGIFSEVVRTNELCQIYSNSCIKLCQELGVKVVDLFSAFQKRDGWTTACFTLKGVTVMVFLGGFGGHSDRSDPNPNTSYAQPRICSMDSSNLNFTLLKLEKTSWFWNLDARCALVLDIGVRDGIHLSAEGSKIVVEEILKVLKEAEWVPSLHWKSMPTEFSEDSPYDLVAADGKQTLNPSEWTFHREVHWD